MSIKFDYIDIYCCGKVGGPLIPVNSRESGSSANQVRNAAFTLSDAFKRYFGPEHGVELPPRARYGYRPIEFDDEGNI